MNRGMRIIRKSVARDDGIEEPTRLRRGLGRVPVQFGARAPLVDPQCTDVMEQRFDVARATRMLRKVSPASPSHAP